MIYTRGTKNRLRTAVVALAFVAFAFAAPASMADAPKIPTTVAEHEALAKQYLTIVAQNKKVAEEHRAMAEAAKRARRPPMQRRMAKRIRPLRRW